MQKTGGSKRLARLIGVGILVGSVALAMGSFASTSSADEASGAPTTDATASSQPPATDTLPPATLVAAPAGKTPPYGTSFPVTLETNFSRPRKAISSAANSDFSLLNDLERLIKGTYIDPRTGKARSMTSKRANIVFLSISRMENSHRVGRRLIAAARAGVTVRVIHGKASQSNESRSLQRALNSSSLRNASFKICQKGKSLACLSGLNGAIMHSKILIIGNTFTRNKVNAKGVIWSGSANLGGPSGERTYNNGLTVYNDKKLYSQARAMWSDMWAERNVRNDYLTYIKSHASKYGYASARADGYTAPFANRGMLYSNLANVTIYPTPIYATPTNGKDPVLMMLNRVIPDEGCRIRVQHNRFKYRRIAVAQKLVELADKGCKVDAVAFEDNLKVNRISNCQLYIRICKPILDVFRTANVRIATAWAKPHDKTMLVEANMGANRLNPEEVPPNGGNWPQRIKLVQAGSAALTGSNLVVSDEITTETTDPGVYDDYLEHWRAILNSYEYHNFVY